MRAERGSIRRWCHSLQVGMCATPKSLRASRQAGRVGYSVLMTVVGSSTSCCIRYQSVDNTIVRWLWDQTGAVIRLLDIGTGTNNKVSIDTIVQSRRVRADGPMLGRTKGP